MNNMKHLPLKDTLVVGIPALLFMALLYSLKSNFPEVVELIGTLVVFIITPALVALFAISRGVFMFFAGALITQVLTASLVYLVSTRDISDSLGLGACAIVIYVIGLSKCEDINS
ncbi:hypothetical protein NGI08_23495 [Klebsiella michiganensis]|nr:MULTISPECIES: hypothetical protein [Klebsiella/Raoultella group]MBZ7757671.1 hypothetical protein [Raoultella ornithinolytica]MEB8081746.1 hypothetical protein [Klebsiella michiganensis]